MKQFIWTIVLVCFAALGLLGVVLVPLSMEGHGGCMAATVSGTSCSAAPLALAWHHITVLQALSEAIPITILVGMLLVGLLLSVMWLRHWKPNSPAPPPRWKYAEQPDAIRPPMPVVLLRWLAQKIHSPAYIHSA